MVLQEPVIEATQGGMAVTVFEKITKDAVAHIDGGVNGLLAYIHANPGKRASELAASLDTPLRSIERWLKQLKVDGKVEFRGAAKTGGNYSLDADE
jgi:ATP-dependent DNA helicase RecG